MNARQTTTDHRPDRADRLTRAASTAGVVVLIALAGAACASKSDVEALRKEVEALKAQQALLARRVGGTAQPQAARPLPASVTIAGAPSRGASSATVALVEFSDYECPFCIRHFQQTAPAIDASYVRTGKIRYFFRDFPIAENHPQAIRAHVAANCANEQGKFWALHDRLFSAPGTHQPADLTARAKEAGLNIAAYETCYASGKYTALVQQSTQYALSLGGNGTPYFIIGTIDAGGTSVTPVRVVSGAAQFSQFQTAIDSVLAK